MEKIDGYIPVTKAKNQILSTIREIVTFDSTVAITKNGLPQAVLMSMEHYMALQETIEVLADNNIMKQLRSSNKELKSKEPLVDLDEL